jgi:hypothetical protein
VARVVGEILPEVGGFCADIWLSSYKVFPNGARSEPKAGAGVVSRLPLANNDHIDPGHFPSKNILKGYH